jgi:hypothetical protein
MSGGYVGTKIAFLRGADLFGFKKYAGGLGAFDRCTGPDPNFCIQRRSLPTLAVFQCDEARHHRLHELASDPQRPCSGISGHRLLPCS